jgi:hypothetical protein
MTNNNEQRKDTYDGWGIRFRPELSLGGVLQMIVVVSSIGFAVLTYATRVDTTQNSVQQLKSDMTSQFSNMTDQVRGLRLDIANLPDVKAEIVQMEKRLDQGDSRNAAQSARLDQLGNIAIGTRSDVDSILRSSAAQVGRPAPR